MTDNVTSMVRRIMVATDRSRTADRAARWAARMASGYEAELLVLQVLVPPALDGATGDVGEAARQQADEQLRSFVHELAGGRGRAKVVVDEDPTRAILREVDVEGVDVLVVGNVGMSGRKQFLLGNVPNRISHNARCTVVIVNTAGGPAVTPYTEEREAATITEGRLLGRAMHIGRVLVKAGLREVLRRRPAADEAGVRDQARRLRSALDELGPTFAKLGQILSTRPDLLPPAFINELATLQDRVTALTEAEVVGVMERELGMPWEDVFAAIEPEPLAAGTIAQVHRARLENGDRVVIKVQRPTAEQDILQDLALLEMFGRRTAERPAFRQVVDLPAIIQHLSASLRRELDFRREASNIERMREVLKPFSRLAVPGVYKEYSTARLLVMEEVQGVPVREAPPGRARKEAARQLLEAYYRQVLVEGFFHADPHPGNMRWWNDRIYLLDLGMVGEVEPHVRELLILLLMAFWQEDADFLSDVVLMLAGEDQRGDEIDLQSFREEMGRLIARYRNLSLQEIQLGPMLQEVTEIAVRHNVRLSASLALTGKAFAQMQLAAAELDPELDPFSVAGSFVIRNTLREAAGSLNPKKLFYELQKTRNRVTRVLEAIERVTGARPGARLQVNFRGTEALEESIARAGRRLSLALGLGGALVGTALTAGSGRVGRWLPATMGGTGAALGAGLLLELLRGGRRR